MLHAVCNKPVALQELKDIIAILGMDELSKKTSNPLHGKNHALFIPALFVAEVFTGTKGRYVPIKETIRGFKGILNGDYDHLPEQAFYMVGSIDEAVEKAKTL